ncbi:hypothetical protein [Chitinophaga sp. CF418]|uniref:hypothetical protein n=1 Tax=Chitinophaga sp. CF418 TaxID=1855287 RepID=UPI000919A2EE|nr:hypothetical protein [Chitinophaga sp. CF418]SHN43898.1 hypothetical protein SAMN05216311_116117 [Chitinophaga sp. CF418]
MAYVKQNMFMDGVSGSIEGMTLRVRKGKTVITAHCGPVKTPPTDQQLVARGKFEDATAYAKEAMTDPEKKLMYAAVAKKNQTAYNAAFQDAAKAPKIVLIDTEKYRGEEGNVITIAVRDIVRAESVKVRILSASGTELEQGDAVAGKGISGWHYTSVAVNPALRGTHILITATDLPGNITEAEKVL